VTTPTQLDRAHHFILEAFITRGRAPTYTEVAVELGVAPEEGRGLLHELAATGLPIWLQPGTDLIASFAPFNELPTPYRVTVDGRQGWFAQCGFESLAMTWLFPAKSIRIDASCPHCSDRLCVVVRDGVLEDCDAQGMVCYVDLAFREWARSWPDT
jgi:hypothetical protein